MKENFDDIIRRRWEERPYPIDPEHREEMAKLLDAQKRRKGFPFWWLGGLVLMIAIGVYGIAEVNKHEAKVEAEMKAISASEDREQEIQAEAESEVVKTQNEISTEKSNDDASSPLGGRGQNAQAKADVNAEVLKTQNEISREKSNDDDASSPLRGRGQNANTEEKVKSKAVDKSMTDAESKKSNSREEEILSAQENKLPPEGGYRVELENPGQVRIASEIATIKVFPDSIEYDPWTNAIYHNGTVRSLNITKPIATRNADEVNFTSDNHPGEIKSVNNNAHPVYLIGEAGAGMVLASKPLYDGGLKFNIGTGIGMRLQPRLHVLLTGGYQMQDGGFDFRRESTVTQPDFGVRSEFNTLEPDRLHFIYGKLGLAYRIKKYSLSAHVGTQYLYGAQGYITIVNHSQFSSEDASTTKYAWLKTDGLRKWQLWSDVAVGYMVLPKLYVQGGVGMYYSSLTEADPALSQEGYYWNGKTAKLQPFITLNYLLHGKL